MTVTKKKNVCKYFFKMFLSFMTAEGNTKSIESFGKEKG